MTRDERPTPERPRTGSPETPEAPALAPERKLRLVTEDDERRLQDEIEIAKLERYLKPAPDEHEGNAAVPDEEPETKRKMLGSLREEIRAKYGIDAGAPSPSVIGRALLAFRKLADPELRRAIAEYNDLRKLLEAVEQRVRIMESALRSGTPKKGPKPPPGATM